MPTSPLLSLPVRLNAHGRIRFEHELCASETRTNPLSGMTAIEELPDRVTKLSGMTGRENVELRHRDFLPSDEQPNDNRCNCVRDDPNRITEQDSSTSDTGLIGANGRQDPIRSGKIGSSARRPLVDLGELNLDVAQAFAH